MITAIKAFGLFMVGLVLLIWWIGRQMNRADMAGESGDRRDK